MDSPVPQVSAEAQAILSSLSDDSSHEPPDSRHRTSRSRTRSPPVARTPDRTVTHPAGHAAPHPVTSDASQIVRFGTPECPREYDHATHTYTMTWPRRYYVMSYDDTIGRYRPAMWQNLTVLTTMNDVTEMWTWKYVDLPPQQA